MGSASGDSRDINATIRDAAPSIAKLKARAPTVNKTVPVAIANLYEEDDQKTN